MLSAKRKRALPEAAPRRGHSGRSVSAGWFMPVVYPHVPAEPERFNASAR